METTRRAAGTFQVQVTPVSGGDNGAASGRMSLAKTFEGDLTGTSTGDMPRPAFTSMERLRIAVTSLAAER